MVSTKQENSSINTATDQMEEGLHQETKLKNQIQSLKSGNRTAILNTVKELRSDGNVSILPDLFDLLLDQDDEEIAGEIRSLLNDLKDKEAAPILSEAIGNPEYTSISTILISACWQNGLSYGKYINTFVEVVINGQYEAAIEAFTVIEEAMGDLKQEERDLLLRNLKYRSKDIEVQKKPLLNELVKVIASY